ncbi:hypothetical protein AB0O76_05830 [Streptomyces sp. NPDC086554]|uniref:hypothetical protein n=1 Tax=Streptomyces sp. NPDC086554 TaxID=3154864 RepID=UPI00343ED5B5
MRHVSRTGRLIALCLAATLLPGCGAGESTPRPDHDREQTAPPPCPGVNVSGLGDPDGSDPVAKSYRVLTEPVYKAACAGDDRRLARLIDSAPGGAQHFATNTCQGCDGSEIVDMWRNDYGLDLTELARLLETPPHWTQGGVLYLRGNHLADFNRGWNGVPASWSGFYPDCRADELCAMDSELADTS